VWARQTFRCLSFQSEGKKPLQRKEKTRGQGFWLLWAPKSDRITIENGVEVLVELESSPFNELLVKVDILTFFCIIILKAKLAYSLNSGRTPIFTGNG